jgi:hypothetical protein
VSHPPTDRCCQDQTRSEQQVCHNVQEEAQRERRQHDLAERKVRNRISATNLSCRLSSSWESALGCGGKVRKEEGGSEGDGCVGDMSSQCECRSACASAWGALGDIFVMPYCTTRTLSLRATMHRGPTVATATWRADKPSPLRHLQAGLARVEGRIERGSTGSTALRQLKMEPSATAPRDSELGLPLKID